MADYVRCNLKTDGWEQTLRKLKRQAIDPQGFVALALKDVANAEAEPGMREKTPKDEGHAKAAWRTGTPKFKGTKRAFIEIVNAVRASSGDFYAVFLEHGTLGKRKKKLKAKTLERRREKLAQSSRAGRLSGAQYDKLYATSGGIKPRRMVRRTLNEIRKRGSVPKAMARRANRNHWGLKRSAGRVFRG